MQLGRNSCESSCVQEMERRLEICDRMPKGSSKVTSEQAQGAIHMKGGVFVPRPTTRRVAGSEGPDHHGGPNIVVMKPKVPGPLSGFSGSMATKPPPTSVINQLCRHPVRKKILPTSSRRKGCPPELVAQAGHSRPQRLVGATFRSTARLDA